MSNLPDFIDALIEAAEAWLRDAYDLLGIEASGLVYAYLAGMSGAATELDYYGVQP